MTRRRDDGLLVVVGLVIVLMVVSLIAFSV